MKKRYLGKGLSALISGVMDSDSVLAHEQSTRVIQVSLITGNRFQPRTYFDPSSISVLAESIRSQGLMQPLLVRRSEGGKYELVCGERRWRAAKEAGLSEVPVIIKDLSDHQALECALIENLQRADLNPIDEANGYRALAEKFGQSHQDIGKAVGRDRATVSNMLRLLELDPKVQKWVESGDLSVGHARALLALDTKEVQCRIADEIVAEGLSVRAVEERIYGPARLAKQGRVSGKKVRKVSPDLRALTRELERALGTKVEIRTAKKGGRIEIHYTSLDDFERILSAIGVRR